MRLIVLSSMSAIMLSILSACGFIFLIVLGALIHSGSPELIDGKEPIEDPKAVGQSCFVAAVIYLGLFGFSYMQTYLINREAAASRTFTSI